MSDELTQSFPRRRQEAGFFQVAHEKRVHELIEVYLGDFGIDLTHDALDDFPRGRIGQMRGRGKAAAGFAEQSAQKARGKSVVRSSPIAGGPQGA